MDNKPKRIDTACVVIAILDFASLAPWLLAVFVSFFAFDRPGSENDPAIWRMVIPVWIYPIPLFICMAVSYLLFKKDKKRAALITLISPPASALLLISLAVAYDLYASAQ